MGGWPGTQLLFDFSISPEVSFWGRCFSLEKGLYEGKPGCWYSDSQLGRGKHRRTFNSGPPTRKLPSHLLFCVHLAVLSFPVSRLKPLSSSCEIALNKLSLAAIGAVFCHFEGSQWSAQEPLSTLIYTPPHGGHTLILYDVSKSFRPASGCPGIGVTSQSLILTPLREDGGKFRWFGGCPL